MTSSWMNEPFSANLTTELANRGVRIVDFVEYQIAQIIWVYVSPVIILLGTIGNMLTLVVMSRPQLRYSVTSHILMALAVVDSLVLLLGLARNWIFYMSNIDIRTYSVVICKIQIFIIYWLPEWSSWILSLVTIERCVSVILPHRSKRLMTQRVTVGAILGTGIILFCIHSPLLEMYQITFSASGSPGCHSRNQYLVLNVWPWIDFVLFCFLPFMIIFWGNVAIVVKLVSVRVSKNKSLKMSSMTTIFIVISVYFLAATMPIEVLLQMWSSGSYNPDPHVYAKFYLFYSISAELMYSNNAVNFFLYIITSPRFRKLFLSLFFKRFKPDDTTQNMSGEGVSSKPSRVAPAPK